VKAPLGIVPRVIRIRIGAEVSEPGTFEDEALDGELRVWRFDPFDLSVGITAQDWLVSFDDLGLDHLGDNYHISTVLTLINFPHRLLSALF
jgi:hypothetical protein